jgi:sugar lactone lactonase YvrE
MKRISKILFGFLPAITLTVAACSTELEKTSQTETTPALPSQTGSGKPLPRVGQVEVMAELDIMPGNVTASKDGRIFVSIHGRRRGAAQLIEITGRNSWEPFPNKEWNANPGSGLNVLNTAHGVAIDSQDRLWVIDHGNWMPDDAQPTQSKLVAFDINTRQLVFRYDFPESTGSKGNVMQDLAVDEERGFVYIADSRYPAIVVVDTNNKTSRRFDNHPALEAEDVDLVVEGQTLLSEGTDGKWQNARVPINPITLSADGEKIFFGAMTGQTWYSVPAKLFRDGASDQAIGAAIVKAGSKPVSDGANIDAEGNHFFTNLEDNAIDMLSKNGKLIRLVRDERFIWPDNIRFGPESWLYVAVNRSSLDRYARATRTMTVKCLLTSRSFVNI